MSGHTQGPWIIGPDDRHGQAVVRGEHIEIATCWHHSVGAIEKEMRANARLIAATPDLLDVVRNFEIKGPDADGLVWLVLHGNGTTGQGAVNLGTADRLVAQVALNLEDQRRAALTKATGEIP